MPFRSKKGPGVCRTSQSSSVMRLSRGTAAHGCRHKAGAGVTKSSICQPIRPVDLRFFNKVELYLIQSLYFRPMLFDQPLASSSSVKQGGIFSRLRQPALSSVPLRRDHHAARGPVVLRSPVSWAREVLPQLALRRAWLLTQRFGLPVPLCHSSLLVPQLVCFLFDHLESLLSLDFFPSYVPPASL